ncbi:unnamed protein product [Diatraea saccharalis]|uniref:Uncharacterized protein n=1 Tax=Diatraea saccharalis TaxID=40085 RepID=A0A9N9R2F7_9NEOP|nr:unnamed protein product [Diatraea saccharalis]
MRLSRFSFFLISIYLHRVVNSPINNKEDVVIIPNLQTIQQNSLVIPHREQQKIALLNKPSTRKQKNHNLLPVTHQLLVPNQLHVIPIHTNFHHDGIHTGINVVRNENINLPIVSHSISHATSNVTHRSPVYLIPIHHTHLVPLHDLTVIPLQREIHTVETKFAHYRTSMERKDNSNEEPVNKYRSFYGGYGNGLFFGGHGAGHGFYAYG